MAWGQAGSCLYFNQTCACLKGDRGRSGSVKEMANT